jgi:putative redox protein
MSDAKPPANPPAPVVLDLEWEGERRFRGRAAGVEIVMDSAAGVGPTPVQTLAFALAGCMAIDLVVILTRGRFELRGLHAHLVADRAPEDPKRILAVDLWFTLTGGIPPDRVERALELSREKYCSVWHSLRQDIDLKTSFEIVA